MFVFRPKNHYPKMEKTSSSYPQTSNLCSQKKNFTQKIQPMELLFSGLPDPSTTVLVVLVVFWTFHWLSLGTQNIVQLVCPSKSEFHTKNC